MDSIRVLLADDYPVVRAGIKAEMRYTRIVSNCLFIRINNPFLFFSRALLRSLQVSCESLKNSHVYPYVYPLMV